MGAMTCGRKGCETAMCTRLVDGSWYICEPCYDDLVRMTLSKLPDRSTVKEIKDAINEWRLTTKESTTKVYVHEWVVENVQVLK